MDRKGKRKKTNRKEEKNIQNKVVNKHDACVEENAPKNLETNDEETESQFNRRKIVSNWDRYEEPVDDVQQRGDNFESVLESGGGTSFKFQEEQEWEVGSADAKTTTCEFLLLDCEDLGLAMHCVPLPNRLMITEDIFPQKLLTKFEKSAKKNCLQYNLKHEGVTFDDCEKILGRDDGLPSVTATLPDISGPFDDNDEAHDESDVVENLEQNVPVIISVPKRVEENVTENPKTEQLTSVGEKFKSAPVHHESEIRINKDKINGIKSKDNEEDDLDFLLSLSSPIQLSTSNVGDGLEEKPVSKEKMNDTALQVQLFPGTSAGDKPSLEDWLDDFLENEN